MSRHWNGHGWTVIGKKGYEGSVGVGIERVPTAAPEKPTARITQDETDTPEAPPSVNDAYSNWQANGGQSGNQVIYAAQTDSPFAVPPLKSGQPFRLGRPSRPRKPVTRREKERARAKRRRERDRERVRASSERQRAKNRRWYERRQARNARRGTGLLARLFGR